MQTLEYINNISQQHLSIALFNKNENMVEQFVEFLPVYLFSNWKNIRNTIRTATAKGQKAHFKQWLFKKKFPKAGQMNMTN